MSKQNNMRSLNWRQRGWRSVGWKNSDVTVEAPADSILHWDADIDAFSEQTGGLHTLNYNVLGPQYQRNADGSTTSVGAKPGVDVVSGKKFLRICGAVDQKADSPIGQGAVVATNTLPTGWRKLEAGATWSVVGAGDGYVDIRFAGIASNNCVLYPLAAFSAASPGQTWSVFLSVDILSGSASGVYLAIRERNGSGASVLDITSGDLFLSRTLTDGGTTGVEPYLIAGVGTYDVTFRIKGINFYQSAYPLPFIPVKNTQPASNATTTNGVWFANPDGSPLWQALTGAAMTAGFRVRLSFSSADLPNSSVLNIATPDDVAGRFLTIQKSAGGALTAVLSDGTNSAAVTLVAWNRGDVLHFFPQVATGATQMRIGYKTDAATSITWGSLATFAGTFGPDSTLDRLMLGYNNAYPMWFNKITAWKKHVTDAEILEAMAA